MSVPMKARSSMKMVHLIKNRWCCLSPNSALQRAAIGIKCSAAGGRAQSAHERWRARVLSRWRAVAELGS